MHVQKCVRLCLIRTDLFNNIVTMSALHRFTSMQFICARYVKNCLDLKQVQLFGYRACIKICVGFSFSSVIFTHFQLYFLFPLSFLYDSKVFHLQANLDNTSERNLDA